jgi:hypothetical protein
MLPFAAAKEALSDSDVRSMLPAMLTTPFQLTVFLLIFVPFLTGGTLLAWSFKHRKQWRRATDS